MAAVRHSSQAWACLCGSHVPRAAPQGPRAYDDVTQPTDDEEKFFFLWSRRLRRRDWRRTQSWGCIRDGGSCDRRQRRKRVNPHSPWGRHKAGGCGGKSCSSRGEMPTFGQPGPEPLLRSSESVLLGRRLNEGVEGGMLPHPRLQHPAPDPSQDPQTPALSAHKTVEQDPPPDPSLRPW